MRRCRKIAVGRGADDPASWTIPFVVAVAIAGAATGGDDSGTDAEAPALPRLDLDRPDHVARFIVERFLTRTP